MLIPVVAVPPPLPPLSLLPLGLESVLVLLGPEEEDEEDKDEDDDEGGEGRLIVAVLATSWKEEAV